MMLLKKIVLLLLFTIPLSLSAQSSCYSIWSDSFDDAVEELANDMERCVKSSWPSRCRYEANLSYDYSIYQAGVAYHRCLGMYGVL